MALGNVATPYWHSPGAAGARFCFGASNLMSQNPLASAHEGQPVLACIVNTPHAGGGIKIRDGTKIKCVLANDAGQPARPSQTLREYRP
jgi:hypothetical protein